jgi:hypothetical protein
MTAIPWVSELLRGLIGEPVSVVAKIIQKKSRQHAPPRIAAPDFFSCFPKAGGLPDREPQNQGLRTH